MRRVRRKMLKIRSRAKTLGLSLLFGCISAACATQTTPSALPTKTMPSIQTATAAPTSPPVFVVTATPSPSVEQIVQATAAALQTQIVATQLIGASGKVVNARQLNVRNAPSAEGSVIARLAYGTDVRLLARNADATWLYIQTPSGIVGWANRDFLVTNLSDLSILPIRR